MLDVDEAVDALEDARARPARRSSTSPSCPTARPRHRTTDAGPRPGAGAGQHAHPAQRGRAAQRRHGPARPADPQRQPHRRHDARLRGDQALGRRGPARRHHRRHAHAARPGRASARSCRAGITLRLVGDANDYVGKGLSGGAHHRAAGPGRAVRGRGERHRRQRAALRRDVRRAVRPRRRRRAVLRAQLRRAGRRRGRRRPRLRVHDRRHARSCSARSGATSRPACPAASPTCSTPPGPSGNRINPEMVDLDPLDDDDRKLLRDVVERHHAETGSTVAARLLDRLGRRRRAVREGHAEGLQAGPAGPRGGRARGRDPNDGDHGGGAWVTRGIPHHPAGAARRAARSTCASRTGARSTRSSRDGPLEKQAGALHGLRHPVLPQRLPAGQPHPGVERPRLPRRVARGRSSGCTPRTTSRSSPGRCARRRARPPACSAINSDAGDDQADRAADHRPRVAARAGSSRSPPATRRARRSRSSGPGPAGLAAAQQLTRVGHDVDGVRAGRPDRRAAALRHPRVQDGEVPPRPAPGPDGGRGHRFRPASNVGDGHHRRAAPAEFDAVVLAGGATAAARPAGARAASSRGIHQAMEYLPLGEPGAAGRPGGAADHRRGQARGDHRRRRHRRGLPRHRAPPGRRVGHPAGDHAAAAGEAHRAHARGRPTR